VCVLHRFAYEQMRETGEEGREISAIIRGDIEQSPDHQGSAGTWRSDSRKGFRIRMQRTVRDKLADSKHRQCAAQ